MNSLLQDLRYGARMLLKQRLFTIVATLSLALGIGANTAIFSVVDSMLIRPLPYPDAERLVAIWSSPGGARNKWTSAYPDYADWRNGTQSFERMAAYNNDRATLRKSQGAALLSGLVASADLFPLLGVQPQLGRAFSAAEDQPASAPVVVLSYETWQRRFQADPNIVGSAILLGDRNVTVIGVMPPGFKFPANRAQVEYYLPLAPAMAEKAGRRSDMFLRCVARLKPGVTVAQAQTDLSLIASRLAASYPDSNANRTAWVSELREDWVGGLRPALLVLFASAGLVLLIACANVANLLLARMTARWRELAARMALGASRARIAAQLFTESALLCLGGGALGTLLATWTAHALLKLQPAGGSSFIEGGVNLRVLLFTLAASMIATIAAGVSPVLRISRVELVGALRENSRGASDDSGAIRLRSALVIAQVALSLALLVGAGLALRSLAELRKVDPGFDARRVFTVTLAPSRARFKSAGERNAYFGRVIDLLRSAPGVELAAGVSPIPFGGSETDTNFSVLGRAPAPKGQAPQADYRVATTDYFQAMKIPLRQGRVFSDADGPRSLPVVIINESFARRYFPNDDPLGKSLIIGADPKDNPNPAPRQIVGVVGDAYHSSLEAPPTPEFYVPVAQETWPSLDLVARYRQGYASSIAAAMRDAARNAGAGESVAEPRPFTALLDNSTRRREFGGFLLGAFAVVALTLATTGLYGVMSYAVARRTREIGIRIAMGAQTGDVLGLILRQGIRLALAGIVIGLLVAFALARSLASLLFGVSATDPLTFGAVSLLLAGVALASCWLPARRATKVDAMVALRSD
jgi:putative ABC transport system permease protein